MKKLFTIVLMLIWGISNAQNYNQSWSKRDKNTYGFITVGFDIRNATFGSEPTKNKAELNYHLKGGFVFKNVELGIIYEEFKRINFKAYSGNVGYIFQSNEKVKILGILLPTDKTDFYIGLEGGSILRYSNSNFLMYGFNGEIRQHVGNRLIIGLQANYRYRSDIDQKNGENDFRASVMLNTTFKFS